MEEDYPQIEKESEKLKITLLESAIKEDIEWGLYFR